MQELIVNLAKAAGEATQEELPMLELLCQAAEDLWKRRLLPGSTQQECMAAFSCAAAFQAAADLLGLRESNASSFSAGGLSMTARGAADAASPAQQQIGRAHV